MKRPITIQQDLLEERAAIMAEANGWDQGKAERTVAWLQGFDTWGALFRKAGATE